MTAKEPPNLTCPAAGGTNAVILAVKKNFLVNNDKSYKICTRF